MRTLAISSVLLFGALVLFIIGMFSGDGELLMFIFCSWTPLAVFWGFSVGRLRIRLVVENPMIQPKSNGIRQSRLVREAK